MVTVNGHHVYPWMSLRLDRDKHGDRQTVTMFIPKCPPGWIGINIMTVNGLDVYPDSAQDALWDAHPWWEDVGTEDGMLGSSPEFRAAAQHPIPSRDKHGDVYPDSALGTRWDEHPDRQPPNVPPPPPTNIPDPQPGTPEVRGSGMASMFIPKRIPGRAGINITTVDGHGVYPKMRPGLNRDKHQNR